MNNKIIGEKVLPMLVCTTQSRFNKREVIRYKMKNFLESLLELSTTKSLTKK